ncbi:EARP-interacting protein, partial [Ilyodon furcidens]
IHIIDFDDENNIINKNVLLHQAGEIWHIAASPADKAVITTCYNKTSDSRVVSCAAVWRMPSDWDSGSHESPGDSAHNPQTLELLCHLDDSAHRNAAWVVRCGVI